jgi:chemotaxis protein methyltransferase CheR
VTPSEYEYLQKLLKDRSGLILSADKQYLVESRLIPLARRSSLAGISELVAKMKAGAEPLVIAVVEAMTTNETFFFRDKVPFEHFKETIMPALLEARKHRRAIRIWCAASSTGQEPYSLAMILKEMGASLSGWRTEIVATDLSQEVLEKSKAGIFSQFEVQRGLPIQLLVKHFTQINETWQLSPEIRAMVQFRQLNLLHDFSQLGTFDIIFCRNVLIYFDQDTKVNVFNRLTKVIEPDGFLVLGAAETVVGLSTGFVPYPERRGLYHPAAAAAPKVGSPSIMPSMPAARVVAAVR